MDNHFNTFLLSVTPGAEKQVLFIARVSSNQENDNPGLLKYLIRNKHWSPFEVVHMVVEIRTSRAIAQQILRHRSFSFQEFSQRYAKAEEGIIYPGRRQAEVNRQSSIDDLNDEQTKWWADAQKNVYDHCYAWYETALEMGIAKECARFLLPLATETKLYMSGSLRSWIHYLEQRCDEHTQLEHREIALDIRNNIFVKEFPIISEALGWNE